MTDQFGTLTLLYQFVNQIYQLAINITLFGIPLHYFLISLAVMSIVIPVVVSFAKNHSSDVQDRTSDIVHNIRSKKLPK